MYKFKPNIIDLFRNLTPRAKAIIGSLFIIITFFIDHVTGDEYRFGILYQLAVVFFAWNFEIRCALFESRRPRI